MRRPCCQSLVKTLRTCKTSARSRAPLSRFPEYPGLPVNRAQVPEELDERGGSMEIIADGAPRPPAAQKVSHSLGVGAPVSPGRSQLSARRRRSR